MKPDDAGFLISAAKHLNTSADELSLLSRLLRAQESYRALSETLEKTKPGADRAIVNEKRIEALAMVLDLKNKLAMMQ